MSDIDDIKLSELTDDQLIKHGYQLTVMEADLKKKKQALNEEVNRRGRRTGTRVVGNASLQLTRPKRFSEELALAKLNKTQQRRITVQKLDSTKAKEEFGEDSPLYQSLLAPAENFTVKFSAATTKQKVLDMDGSLEDPFVIEAEIVEN